MKKSLNNRWTLYYIKDKDFESFDKLKFKDIACFKNVQIPCSFENILFKNKVLGNPYYSTNPWKYQEYEDVHQVYVNHFDSINNEAYITFEGIDTISEIYVNGDLVGKTDNMYLPYTFKLKNLKSKNNIIQIHILPCVLEGRKFDKTKSLMYQKYAVDGLNIRKPASAFGWDILPRFAIGGICKEIYLLDELEPLKNIKTIPSFSDDLKNAKVLFEMSFNKHLEGTISIVGKCKDSSFKFEKEINGNALNIEGDINNVLLWNIRGYGEQNLYKTQVFFNKKLIYSYKYGFRKIEFRHSSIICENGAFEFHINNKKVFLLGNNYVPVDGITHYDENRSRKFLKLTIDSGCNAIRIWGGGVYEQQYFYELCDKYGLFVWQDFMMGCAHYPQDDDFQRRISEEVTFVVNDLYNHPSICLWAGDNENDAAIGQWIQGHSPKENRITRVTLPKIMKELDCTREFLPSSPYIDEVGEKNLSKLAEDHVWGPRDYFKGEYYKNAYPYFASETGYHGLNSPKSLYKFLQHPWPLFIEGTKPTEEHLCHSTSVANDYKSPYAYRTELMYNQVKTLFTEVPKDLKSFSLASQISQAEAVKFFIEKMRKDYKRNGGIIWWNMLDGWPQVSDAVVDYYFDKKVAYYYIKRSQTDTLFMMDEDGKNVNLILSSNVEKPHTYICEIYDAYQKDKLVYSGKVTSKFNESILVSTFAQHEEKSLYIITYKDENGKKYINHFHTDIINIDLNKYTSAMRRWGLIK